MHKPLHMDRMKMLRASAFLIKCSLYMELMIMFPHSLDFLVLFMICIVLYSPVALVNKVTHELASAVAGTQELSYIEQCAPISTSKELTCLKLIGLCNRIPTNADHKPDSTASIQMHTL